MQMIDQSTQYYISPVTQPSVSIAVNVYREGTLSGQSNDLEPLIFNITTSKYDETRNNICTTYHSEPYCLDQWGDNVTQVALQEAEWSSGQEWLMSSSIDPADGSTIWRMQSEFGGPDRYLAIDGANLIMSSNSTRSATEWKLIDLNPTSTSTTVTSSSPTSTASTPITTGTTSDLSSGNPRPKPSTNAVPLAAGAIAGIVIGVVLLLAMVAVALLIMRRRKSRSVRPNALSEPAYTSVAPFHPAHGYYGKPMSQPEIAEVPAEQHASYKPVRPIYHELGDK